MDSESKQSKNGKPKGKYVEYMIMGLITGLIMVILLPAVVYLYLDYEKRLSKIEKAMHKIAGTDWENSKYDNLPDILEINDRLVCLDRQKFKILLEWSKAVDKMFMENYSKPIIGYAHITDRLNNSKPKVLLNVSNLYGAFLKIGDKIQIINTESPLNEKVNAIVFAKYSDLQNTDVIIQVNHDVANTINFDPKRGKLKIKLIRLFDNNNRWYSLEERLKGINK